MNTKLEKKLDLINSKLDKLLSLYGENSKIKQAKSAKKISVKKTIIKPPLKINIDYSNLKVIIYKYLDKVLVKGDTYNIRTTIRKYNAHWSPENKGWIIKLSKFSKLKNALELLDIKIEIKTKNKNLDGPSKVSNSGVTVSDNDCMIMSSSEDD